jgi:23S rRNA pseudouridine1911/1915/1917 synthase
MQIIHEDDNIIVCHKPAGIATQSADLRSKDMVSLVKTHLVRQARKNKVRLTGEPYVGLIHRLDQPVEGILVMAKDKESAANLSKQVTDNKIEKYYYALVQGTPDETKAHISKKISEDGNIYIEDEIIKKTDGNAQIVTGISTDDLKTLGNPEDKKVSKLEYKLISSKDGNSLIEVHLITGRFHQIRATMSYLRCPIVGDTRYGAKEISDKEMLSDKAIALCSYKLTFKHPVTGKALTFKIDPSEPMFNGFKE